MIFYLHRILGELSDIVGCLHCTVRAPYICKISIYPSCVYKNTGFNKLNKLLIMNETYFNHMYFDFIQSIFPVIFT
jgi:hypothetical protein